MSENEGRITRLWLTMIRVSDMKKAVNFYNKTLDLPLALYAKTFNHAEVGPVEPLAKIGLYATGKKSKRKTRTGIVFDTDDIYKLYENLQKKGVRFIMKPTRMEWGGIMTEFLDPDNNIFQVVQDKNHYKATIAHSKAIPRPKSYSGTRI